MREEDDRDSRADNGSHERDGLDDLTVQSAGLDSPLFEERWNVGAPLDWIEFIERCDASPQQMQRDEAEEPDP